MSSRARVRGWFATATIAGLAGAIPAAAQVDFHVNSLVDEIDLSAGDAVCLTSTGNCTLRAAVMQANALLGFSVNIYLQEGTYHLTLTPSGADDAASGDLNLLAGDEGDDFIAVIGVSAPKTIIDGDAHDRVFRIDAGRTANFYNLTVRNGHLTPGAGPSLAGAGRGLENLGTGIANLGTLVLSGCAVRDSVDPGAAGGGIYNGGVLGLSQTSISGNVANAGGGIYSNGEVTIELSTVSGNQASDSAGGIYTTDELTVINSTISLNAAGGDGGGIYGSGIANFYNSTIAFNEADSDVDFFGLGAGIYVVSISQFAVRNTLLAGNYLSESPTYDDCAGTLGVFGQNLYSGIPNCTFSGPGFLDQLNSLGFIGPLQYNGGPTQTHALIPGSFAINGGDFWNGCIGPDSSMLASDQRGVPRTLGFICDVGAFESGPIFFDGFETGDPSHWSA